MKKIILACLIGLGLMSANTFAKEVSDNTAKVTDPEMKKAIDSSLKSLFSDMCGDRVRFAASIMRDRQNGKSQKQIMTDLQNELKILQEKEGEFGSIGLANMIEESKKYMPEVFAVPIAKTTLQKEEAVIRFGEKKKKECHKRFNIK